MKKTILSLIFISHLSLFAQFPLVGPDGPEMNISFDGVQLKFILSNGPTSNNYLEMYEEMITNSNQLAAIHPDSTLNFQGYMIYQLLDSTVTWDERNDTTRVRLVFQSDISDSIDTLVNIEMDPLNICGPMVKVEGNNMGIVDTFSLTINPFNHQAYQLGDNVCFWGVAYAYNAFMVNPDCSENGSPFFAGPRKTENCLFGLSGMENAEIPHLKLYPNPSIHYFEITGDFENAGLELMNMQGQVVMNKNVINGEKIPVEGLSKGVYVTRIWDGNSVSCKKLIVN